MVENIKHLFIGMVKVRILLIFFTLLFTTAFLNAQFTDKFNNDVLENDWKGDRHAFIVQEGLLKLDTMDSGIAALYRKVMYPDSFLLEGQFSLDFPPSSSNNLQIYFLTDSIDTEVASGYLMKLGESGSDDALEIYRIDKDKDTLLWRGTDGKVADDPMVNYKIKRDGNGHWTINIGYNGSIPARRGSFIDTTYHSTSETFFHLRCEYTSTRSMSFSFDELAVKAIVPDTIPPELTDYTFENGDKVSLQYDEKLQPSSLEAENFSTESTTVKSVTFMNDSTGILLEFQNSLPIAVDNQLQISGITDRSGNTAADTTITLFYYNERPPQKSEIILTEILPDPSEDGFLPAVEFIEILNISDAYLQLNEVIYADASSEESLSEYVLKPGQYLLICESESAPDLSEYGNVMGLNSFPSLNNAGDKIQLKSNGMVIDELQYDDALYENSAFRQNGYSLELQQIYDPCAPYADRWGPCKNVLKASPGSENSIWETSGSVSEIKYNFYSMPADQVIAFNFSKTLDSNQDSLNINIQPQVQIINKVIEDKTLRISLEMPLSEGVDYTFKMSGLSDCAENITQDFSITVQAVKSIGKGDLMINEILYDPPAGTEQYLELKNCSSNALNLSDVVIISYRDSVAESFTIPDNRILPTGDLILLSSAPGNIDQSFNLKYPSKVLKVSNMPSMDREMGRFSIKQMGMRRIVTIDSMIYRDKFHTAFLNETKGVSLERIDCKTDGVKAEVWTSAAQTVNYGTPTYENSQSRVLSTSDTIDLFNLVSPTFSPDGDGYEDQLLIQYTGDKKAQRIRFEVYDLNGRRVNVLLNNTGVSKNELLKWDGATERETIALPGIYILYAEVYDEEGRKLRWKSSCVLAF